MCCGQKRRALALGHPSTTDSSGARPTQAINMESTGRSLPEIDLLYLQPSPIQLRGIATGRLYQFSRSQPVQAVDQRDATAFLRTPRLFRPTKK